MVTLVYFDFWTVNSSLDKCKINQIKLNISVSSPVCKCDPFFYQKGKVIKVVCAVTNCNTALTDFIEK